MRRINVRRQQSDNQNNKRWSTPVIGNNDQEEQISITSQSPCLTLLTNKLGIPKEKAERACVATGFRSSQVATDWLVKRHDDNKSIRTEFILLLCPDDRLNEQIRTFNGESFRYLTKETSLKDRQHLRAFKLSSFFYVPDRYVFILHRIFDLVINQYHHLFKQFLRFILHLTSDYLMLIPDSESKKIVEKIFDMIKQQFEQIVPNVVILPAKQLAHLTLAHGLSSLFNLSLDQRTSLIQLARACLDFDRPINWNLRLYSREQSSVNEVLYRVVSSTRETTINNCLLLKANDLFMVLDNGRIGEQENVFGEEALIKLSFVWYISLLFALSLSSLSSIKRKNKNISSCVYVFVWPLRDSSLSLLHAHKMFFVSLTTRKAQDTVTFDASLLDVRRAHTRERRERERARERKANDAHTHKLHHSTTSE